MKNLRLIVYAVALALAVTGCQQFKDIQVKSCDIESLSPKGLTAFDAVLKFEVSNPAPQVTLSEMNAVIMMDEKPCMYLTADDVTLEPRSDMDYTVFFHGKLDDNFNPFSLLTLLREPGLDSLTVNLGFRGTLKSGLSKYFEYKDIPVKDLLNKQ